MFANMNVPSARRPVAVAALIALLGVSACGGGGGGGNSATPVPAPGTTPTPTPTPVPAPEASQGPVITAQPDNVAVLPGQPATFTAAAAGSGNISYQWLRNGVEIGGATNASFTLASASVSNNGSVYSVRARHAGGATESAAAMLTVRGSGILPFVGVTGEKDDFGVVASIQQPTGIAVDSAGNLYVGRHSALFKIGGGGQRSDIKLPSYCDNQDMQADQAGNVYVLCHNAMVRFNPAGVPTLTVGDEGISGDADGSAATARFSTLSALALDDKGNAYVADSGNGKVRRIDGNGTVTTLAGSGLYAEPRDGVGSGAGFNNLGAIAVDAEGNVVVSDGSALRKVTQAGVVTTLAGQVRTIGSADGAGASARFSKIINALTFDRAGNLIIADSMNHIIRKMSADGRVSTIAGLAGRRAYADGAAASAAFNLPLDVNVDAAGNIYVADRDNNAIRRIGTDGIVSTVSGTPAVLRTSGYTDGPGMSARFHGNRGLATDAAGNVYVADAFNSVIRKISPSGVVSTAAGSPALSRRDGRGTGAGFTRPRGVAVGPDGSLYVIDAASTDKVDETDALRKIAPDGSVTTIAVPLDVNDGVLSDGSPPRLFFNALATDAQGNVYLAAVSDGAVCLGAPSACPSKTPRTTIRKISAAGAVRTLLTSETAYPGGLGRNRRALSASALATDRAGNLYIADAENGVVLKVTPGGAVSTFTDTIGFANGALLTVDQAGNLYMASRDTGYIRRIAPDGVTSVFAGDPTIGYRRPATFGGIASPLPWMYGLAVDAQGTVYVSVVNGVVKVVTP